MAIAIRSYRNTDSASICKVWNAHHGGLGVGPITPLHFELAALAKPYFLATDLLVATVDDEMQGFLHLSHASSADLTEADKNRGVLSALCVTPCENEEAIAAALLSRADEALALSGVASCATRPMPPDCPFYLGLGAGDSMMGITTADQRTYSWLVNANWVPRQATSGWELFLDNFQPPVDRVQIQIRRMAHVDRMLDEPMLPWRQACLLGHTEPTGFQLTLRAEGTVAQELLVWSVGQELMTTPESIVWLWPIEVVESTQVADQLVFLLSESLRQMADDRVEVVRTYSDSAKTQVTSVLTRLGFRNAISGVVLEKLYKQTR
ncbi:MAG: hypothetical protein SFV81_02765 [Pirellulaceae bacterium]|nr:hypothetical protein [Pirellulaceae bacterium]